MAYRVEWWLDRFRSPEYQAAYDKIVDYLNISNDEIIVDVACGPREIIRRLGRGKIIGVDSNIQMFHMTKI